MTEGTEAIERTPISEGVYYDVPMGTYHSWDAMNASGLKQLADPAKTPAHFWYDWSKGPEPPPHLPPTLAAASMTIGTALHTLLLKPENLDMHVVRMPEQGYSKKEDKENWIAIRDANPGKVFCRPDVWERVERMAAAAVRNPAVKELVDAPGMEELSIVRELETKTGRKVKCRSRIDKAIRGPNFLVDAKTSRCAAPYDYGFPKYLYENGYYLQAGMYMHMFSAFPELFPAENFIFLVVENFPPYEAAVYNLNEADIAQGFDAVQHWLEVYAECIDRGYFPGYSDKVQPLTMPSWSWKRLSEV